MNIVTLKVKIPSDQQAAFLDAARMFIGPTQVQAGCISCSFFQDVNDPDIFALVEEWDSREALNTHLNSEDYQIILSLIDMSTEKPEFKISTIAKTEGLEAIKSSRGMSNKLGVNIS